MASRHLDVPRLAEAVRVITRHRNITMREAAAEMGVPPSGLTRLTQGRKPDADGLLSLLAWLRADASEYTASDGTVTGDG